MDTRVKLLKEFYSTMQTGKLKLESREYGFDFLDRLLSTGLLLEYGELASGLIHKYKLSNVSEEQLNYLLQEHVNKGCNVCLYFNEAANNTFCFNLDHNYKLSNTAPKPEIGIAAGLLTGYLEELDMKPLVTTSGRGYHFWTRLDEPVDNNQLYDFMLRMAARTLAGLHENGYDYNKIKLNMYPNNKIIHRSSLRLFGSEHVKNKIFSYIRTKTGIVNEEHSWQYFADYLINGTISRESFAKAYNAVMT
ncbi:Hypothetical protein LUCI_1949 [Lucifera butyrica]|uniref:Uncharacterized protein n=1 Tax=Lucifera butyrica TaxID=1351585 RepID=A0A498R994_9FIRM|nr:hypothetical protein [Lucifera butyrica]VBB06713.1 Hypothetical protein LUCI_1949 [Lucifera butyrica]